jgi:alanine racemase
MPDPGWLRQCRVMNAERAPSPAAAAPAPAGLPPGLLAAAVIDLDAIRHNVELLGERAGSAGVMAVVKADAYGHGLLPCARAALAGGASWLGVAHLAEGLALRAGGIQAPVLAWLTVPADAYPAAISAGIDIGVSAAWALAEVAGAARGLGVPARVQLKIDTGLNRNGAGAADWPDLVDATLKLQAEGLLELVGVFSHLAWADDPVHPTVFAQTAEFIAAIELAEGRGARFELRHLANSAAAVTNSGTHFDLVRPGLAVYGLSPVPELASARDLGLRPAMSLLARVANVKRVAAGQGVSYGHAYTTRRATTLALVPLGYADGLPRQAGNTGPVQLAGQRRRISGRVSMDQVVVDLADPQIDPDEDQVDLDVRVGDVAVLFGAAPGEPTAQDWAEAAGTISYEIVSRVGARVPRLYLGTAGKDVGQGNG